MALTSSPSHSAFLKLSSSTHGEAFSSSNSTPFMGASIAFSRSTLSGNQSASRKQLVVFSRKISGLEEAIRIKRQRELQGVADVKRRPPLRRGRVSPRLPVPDNIPKPPYVDSNTLPEISSEYQIHNSDGIAKMRAACELAARVLNYAGTLVRPSITTNEIDKAVHQMIVDAGAYPSPLGYGGFPKSVCTSINECMCHGIPDSRQLQNGDIINIDVTVYLNGYHGDTSKTFFCGDVTDAMRKHVEVAEECMERGIAVCKDGAPFRKIGKRIRDNQRTNLKNKNTMATWQKKLQKKALEAAIACPAYVPLAPTEHAEKYGYGVVERFVGHGVGTVFHSEPIIFHHRNDKPGCMVEGQTFTIEPILTMGSIKCITWPDNWTTVTADGSPAAQFEHTILITRTGAEILTTC